jgi:hypothetical protein
VPNLLPELQPRAKSEENRENKEYRPSQHQGTAPLAPRKPKCFRNERGMTLALTVVLMIPIGLMAALFMDVGRLYAIRVGMQVAADAAALAAASALIDGDAQGDSVQARAEYFIAVNPIGRTSAILESLDMNTDTGMIRLVLKYQTAPLLFAPGGITVRIAAGAVASGLAPGEEESRLKGFGTGEARNLSPARRGTSGSHLPC